MDKLSCRGVLVYQLKSVLMSNHGGILVRYLNCLLPIRGVCASILVQQKRLDVEPILSFLLPIRSYSTENRMGKCMYPRGKTNLRGVNCSFATLSI